MHSWAATQDATCRNVQWRQHDEHHYEISPWLLWTRLKIPSRVFLWGQSWSVEQREPGSGCVPRGDSGSRQDPAEPPHPQSLVGNWGPLAGATPWPALTFFVFFLSGPTVKKKKKKKSFVQTKSVGAANVQSSVVSLRQARQKKTETLKDVNSS